MDLGAEENWHNWPDADDPDLIDSEDSDGGLYSRGTFIKDNKLGEKNYTEHHPVHLDPLVSNICNQEQEQEQRFVAAQPQHYTANLPRPSQVPSSQFATSQSVDTEPTSWESLFDFTFPEPEPLPSSPLLPALSSPDPFVSRSAPPGPSPQDPVFVSSSHSKLSVTRPAQQSGSSAYSSIKSSFHHRRSASETTLEKEADTPNHSKRKRIRDLGPDYVPALVKGLKPTRDGDWVNYFLEKPEQLRRKSLSKPFDWNDLQLEVSALNQLLYYPGTSTETSIGSGFSKSVASPADSIKSTSVAQSSFVPTSEPLPVIRSEVGQKGYNSPYLELRKDPDLGENATEAQNSTEATTEEPCSRSSALKPLAERLVSVEGSLSLYTQETPLESRAPSLSSDKHPFKASRKRTTPPDLLPGTKKTRLVCRTPSPEKQTFRTPLKRSAAVELSASAKRRRLVNRTPVSGSPITRIEPSTTAGRLRRSVSIAGSSVGWTRPGSRDSPVPSSPLDSRRSSVSSQKSRRGSLPSLPAGHIPDQPPNLEAPPHVRAKYQPDLDLEGRPSKPSLIVNIPISGKNLTALRETGRVEPTSDPIFAFPLVFRKKALCEIVWPGSTASELTTDMAPGYRNQNRRQNRTAVDHDIFEGLPVPQWRREPVTVAPPPTQESTTIQNDIWAVELPHGMPKDSHLLPQHSQDLLRAARSGKIYKRPLPVEEEEADAEAILGDKPEKKDDETKDRGFVARAWKRIPRHMEGPDQNYLAPRRKGLITATSKPPAAGPTLTKATVRRTDAAGNEYVQDVVVPHGQAVEGEVIAQTVIPDPAAAPVDAYAVQPTPPRRKGPVSKKKKKSGPGRGKKKNMAPTSVPQALPADGSAPVSHATAGAVDAEMKTNSGTATSAQTNEDTEMGEGSNAASDDDDGSDGGSGDEDEGSIDTQNSPSKPPRHSQSPTPTSLPSMRDIPDSLAPPAIPAIFPPHLEREKSEGKLGSPLKNVALSTSALSTPLTSPTETAPPMLSSSALPMPSLQEKVKVLETESIDEILQDQTSAIAPPTLPLPEPTQAEESASQQLRKEEEAEEMLLDIVEGVNAPSTIVSPPATVSTPTGMNEKSVSALEPEVAPKTPQAEVAKDVEIEKKAEDDDDDNFPDLLGGLEKSLATPERKALG